MRWRYTIENGKLVKVPEDEYLYLGRDVPDLGSQGYDRVAEVIGTLREIEEDWKGLSKMISKGYANRTVNARLMRLALIVSNDSDFDCEQKEILLKKINEKRRKFGFKEINIANYLKYAGCPVDDKNMNKKIRFRSRRI